MEQLLSDMEKVYQRFVDKAGHDVVSELFHIHIQYIYLYIHYEQFEKAQAYVNKIQEYIEQLPESYFINFQVALLELFTAQKQYAQALAVADTLHQYYVKTNHSLNILEGMAKQIQLLAYLNRGDEAAEKFKQYYTMRNAVEAESANLKLDQLRTQYEVEKITAEKKRNQYYFLFTLGSALLLAIALGIWIYHSRIIIRKNRDLYRRIKEQDRMVVQPLGNVQQRQLVSRLRERLLKDRYFAISDIDISKLVAEMAISRTPLFEAVKSVTGHTPMEFINHLRLEEAKRLLDHSGLTIETIASDCGFSTLSTFYRQFRERYSITPAEYRKIAKSG